MSGKNKYDFITELLDNPKLKSNQLNKLIHLATQEIKSDSTIGSDLEKRIKALERKINGKKEGERNIKIKSSEIIMSGDNLDPIGNNKPKKRYFPPRELHDFLYNFNQNPILRTTCHEIDSDEFDKILEFCETDTYDFNIHRDKVQKEFNEKFYEQYYSVHPNIKALIKAYLTGKNRNGKVANWTNDSVNYNWNSPELIKWSEDNPGLVPHPNDGFKREANYRKEFIFKPSIPIKLLHSEEVRIRRFKDLVLHFKNLFHIKGENSLFKIISNENIRNIDYWSNIDFVIEEETFPTNLTFFTNVEKFIQAYRKLIELIVEVHNKNYDRDKEKVELKLGYNQNNELEFSIFHIDSIFQKDIAALLDNNDGQSFSNLIDRQINGLCDFYIEADFNPVESFKVNLWNGKKREKIPLDEKVGGVKYILILKSSEE